MEPQDNPNPIEEKTLALDSNQALPIEAPDGTSSDPIKSSSHPASPSDLIIIAEPKSPPPLDVPPIPDSPKADTLSPESLETTTTPPETTTSDPNPSTPVEPQLPPLPTSPLVPPIISPPVIETPTPPLVSAEAQPPKKSKLIPISIILLILFLAVYAAITLSELFTK